MALGVVMGSVEGGCPKTLRGRQAIMANATGCQIRLGFVKFRLTNSLETPHKAAGLILPSAYLSGVSAEHVI
jgi:hypothetical protein